jgi:hypothetical protein
VDASEHPGRQGTRADGHDGRRPAPDRAAGAAST